MVRQDQRGENRLKLRGWREEGIVSCIRTINWQVLGSGTYGSVIKAKVKGTKIWRAVKIIPKGKVKDPLKLTREINILREMVNLHQDLFLGSP